MGNSASSTGSIFATAAMAKYTNLTKAQIITFSDAVAPLARVKRPSDPPSINRNVVSHGLREAHVSKYSKEYDVIDLLFTLWDESGTNRVPCLDFCVGISVLACPGETLEEILKFGLQILNQQQKGDGMISCDQSIDFLNS